MAFSNVDPNVPVTINVSRILAADSTDFLRRFCVVSNGDSNIEVGKSVVISQAEIDTVFNLVNDQPGYYDTFLYRFLSNYFANNSTGTVTVLETGSVSTEEPARTIDECIKVLSDYIADGTDRHYMYAVPNSFYVEDSFVTLAKGYAGITAAQYFAVEFPSGSFPDSDATFAKYAGLKSVFSVISSRSNGNAWGENLGAFVGRIASPIYNISATNPNTPLNYKTIVGGYLEKFSTSYRLLLNNAPINYVGYQLGSNCIYNGRYLDNTSFDFYYALDWFIANAKSALTSAIVNGANVPSAVIKYNQDGIDKLLSVLNQIANNGVANGTITAFAESLSSVGELQEIGTFAAIPFETYKLQNPTNYAKEIYDGFSGVIRIGRFFRQVVFNLTIE